MNNKGNSSLIVIIFILIVVVVGTSAAAYYFLKSQGTDVAVNSGDYYQPSTKTKPASTPQTINGISNSSDISTLEKELDNTDTGSTDSDLQTLDSQTTGL